MEFWTGALSWWKCHWPDLKSAGLFDGISSWAPLKPQHSNPNPNPLANSPPTPLTIPHRLPAFLDSLMLLKNWCSIHAWCSKSSLKHSIRFCGIFLKFKTEFYCISFFGSVLTSRLHFEIYQLWQSDFSMVYFNCCCSCSFKSEIIKIGQSSPKRYWNNILNFQESSTIINACTKNSGISLNTPCKWNHFKKNLKKTELSIIR